MDICLCCSDEEIYNVFFDEFTFFVPHLHAFGKNYTLVNIQIHGEYNEQRINFIRLFIQKLWWII